MIQDMIGVDGWAMSSKRRSSVELERSCDARMPVALFGPMLASGCTTVFEGTRKRAEKMADWLEREEKTQKISVEKGEGGRNNSPIPTAGRVVEQVWMRRCLCSASGGMDNDAPPTKVLVRLVVGDGERRKVSLSLLRVGEMAQAGFPQQEDVSVRSLGAGLWWGRGVEALTDPGLGFLSPARTELAHSNRRDRWNLLLSIHNSWPVLLEPFFRLLLR
ncbi:hypothetical protein BKA81DRAFT_59516 [Phyllosticta paracitricarpa]|uniref:Uncharacterized protein n=1 Tax=Phyllosticta citricarpa TaxID=55181 RepID=A0ABR1MMB6_9PEZI